jgi:bifunctional DNA-binding transcriptional regulator/antitoxin component of YhaV-PrlF toxin-antitoxin module
MKLTQEEINKILEEAPKDEKGRSVIPDDVFVDNLANIPDGTISDARKLRCNSGYIVLLEKGTEEARAFASKGGTKAGEVNRERRKIAETIDIFLKSTDKDGRTMQEKIVEAMGLKAMDGCVGAFEALRDTVGEKPTDNVSVDVMTDGDKELMAKLLKRMGYDEGTAKK